MNAFFRFTLCVVAPLAAISAATAAIAAPPSHALPASLRAMMQARAEAAAPPMLPIPPPPAKSSGGKIKHVIIIMQENRSFDNLFQGYPGADTQSWGYDSNGNKINLAPIGLEGQYDIAHDISTYFTACNGTGSLPGTSCRMNGFDKEPTDCFGSKCANAQYGYVPANESAPYFNMASQYVLGDRTFTSDIDDSFISHQYLIAGQAYGTAYFPSNAWGCEGGSNDNIPTLNQNRSFGPQINVCWDINTLGDELDHHHKSWKFYASKVSGDGGGWSSYQAIRHIYYGRDWTRNVINPQTQFFNDVSAGKLAHVTWITPTCYNSDHAGCGSNHGPSWVTQIVDAVGQSKFWDSSAIFIMWDEWGGWYDHVAPPLVDYDGLGFRVPLLIISPYAKQGYVSHVQYEHGSLLRFAEDQFGLPRMTASDTRANSPADDAFDFSQPARPFRPFAAPRSGYQAGLQQRDRRMSRD